MAKPIEKLLEEYNIANKVDLILLGDVPEDLKAKEDLKMEDILAVVKYVVVSTNEGKAARELTRVIREDAQGWDRGKTALGDHLISKYFAPNSEEAAALVLKKDWSKTLIKILGLALYFNNNKEALEDNEIYTTEPEKFSNMFADYSLAWRHILDHIGNFKSNHALHISVDKGQSMKKFVDQLFEDINAVLEKYKEHFDGDVPAPHVTLKEEEVVEEEPEDEDEDDDDEEEPQDDSDRDIEEEDLDDEEDEDEEEEDYRPRKKRARTSRR